MFAVYSIYYFVMLLTRAIGIYCAHHDNKLDVGYFEILQFLLFFWKIVWLIKVPYLCLTKVYFWFFPLIVYCCDFRWNAWRDCSIRLVWLIKTKLQEKWYIFCIVLIVLFIFEIFSVESVQLAVFPWKNGTNSCGVVHSRRATSI